MKKTMYLCLVMTVILSACGPNSANSTGKKESQSRNVISINSFITTEGEHIISGSAYKVHVYEENNKLNYKMYFPSGSGGGPTLPNIKKDSDWFIYVESNERYWIFDGNVDVKLMELRKTSERVVFKTSDLPGTNYTLFNVMPSVVKNKLPKNILEQKNAPAKK